MKRLIASAAALLLFVSCATSINTPDTFPKRKAANPIARALHSTALVQSLEGRTFCSATIVQNTSLLISAWHCFEDGAPFQIQGFHGTYRAIVVLHDEKQDLAVLLPTDVSISPRDGIPIAEDAPKISEPVFALGHAQGDKFPYTVTSGMVSFARRADGDGIWMQSTAPLIRGMSGGPTLNVDGELVGINRFAYVLPIANIYGHAHHSQIVRAIRKAL